MSFEKINNNTESIRDFYKKLIEVWESTGLESMQKKSKFEKELKLTLRKGEKVEIKVDFPGQNRMKYLKALSEKHRDNGLEVIVIATEDEKQSCANEFASGVQWERK